MVEKLVGNAWSVEWRGKNPNVLVNLSLNNWKWSHLAGKIRHELTPKKVYKIPGVVKQCRH